MAEGICTRDDNLLISVLILGCLMIFFVIDINTPPGLSAGVLLFIPLFLTLCVEMRNEPFSVSGIIIVLIAASYVLCAQDMFPLFALLDRLFFICMLVASVSFNWNYKQSGKNLKKAGEITAFSRNNLHMRCLLP